VKDRFLVLYLNNLFKIELQFFWTKNCRPPRLKISPLPCPQNVRTEQAPLLIAEYGRLLWTASYNI